MNARLIALPVLLFAMAWEASSAPLTKKDCDGPDYSERFGPVRDQGDFGNCYAAVAADLIGFAQGLRPPERVSAIDVGAVSLSTSPQQIRSQMQQQENWSEAMRIRRLGEDHEIMLSRKKNLELPERMEGGLVGTTVESYNFSGGVCTEDRLRSQGPIVRQYKDSFARSQVWGLATGEDLLKADGSILLPGFQRSPVLARATDRAIYQARNCPVPKNPAEAFRQDLNAHMVQSLRERADKACAPRKPLKTMSADDFVTERGENSFAPAFISESLRNGYPVGVGYDSDLFHSGRKSPQKEAGHASLIVAQRWNPKTKTCEFKLRNSWGPSCKGYHPDFSGARCDAGSFWLTEKDLRDRVDVMTTVDAK